MTIRTPATAANVKAVIGFYGVYDMQAQWLHDQITRPRDQITEKFLGVSPMQSRRVYFDASPMSYATVEKHEKTAHALPAGSRHQRRYRRPANAVAGVPHRAEAGRLLRPHHRRSGRRALLGERAGRGGRQLWRPGGAADAPVPAGSVPVAAETLHRGPGCLLYAATSRTADISEIGMKAA